MRITAASVSVWFETKNKSEDCLSADRRVTLPGSYDTVEYRAFEKIPEAAGSIHNGKPPKISSRGHLCITTEIDGACRYKSGVQKNV